MELDEPTRVGPLGVGSLRSAGPRPATGATLRRSRHIR